MLGNGRQGSSLALGPEALGLWGLPPGVGERHSVPAAQSFPADWKAGPDQDSGLAVWGWEPIWKPDSERSFHLGSRGLENRSEAEQGRCPFLPWEQIAESSALGPTLGPSFL